jgi:hypothetical protein
VNAYNQGAGSLDARVLPQLRRLEEAGAGSETTLAALAGLDTPEGSPELTGRDGANAADPPPAEAA